MKKYKILHIPSALYVTGIYTQSLSIRGRREFSKEELTEALSVCTLYQLYVYDAGDSGVIISDDIYRTSGDIKITNKLEFEIVEVDDDV